VFLVAIQRIEIFFIKERINFETVAIYFSAFNLILVIQLFLRSSITSRYKLFVDKKIGRRQLFLELGIALLVILVISYYTIPWVFSIVYTNDYFAGITIFRILLLILPFYLINTFFINHFNVINMPQINTIILSITFTVKLIVLLLLNSLTMTNYAWLSIGFEVFITLGFSIAFMPLKFKKS